MSDIIFNDKNEVIDLKNKNKADFKSVVTNNRLSEDFILENADFLDWNIISENQVITVEIMAKCAKKIKWAKIPKNTHIGADAMLVSKYKGEVYKLFYKETVSDDFIRTYQDVFNLEIAYTGNFSLEILEELGEKFNWQEILNIDRKNEAFLRRNLHHLKKYENAKYKSWWIIACNQSFTEQFARDFQEKLTLECVGRDKNKIVLSDAFVEEFKYVLDAPYIRQTQKTNLSKTFLKDYAKFDLEKFYQNTSEDWIEDYILVNGAHKLDWMKISSKSLSETFILKFWDKIYFYNLVWKNIFTEEFTRKIIPQLKYEGDLQDLFRSQSYSEEFLVECLEKYSAKNIHKIKLRDISHSPTIKNLSEDFIRKHKNSWDFAQLCKVKLFSEDFLREFVDKWEFDWAFASSQTLSEQFLRDFAHKFGAMGWRVVCENQQLSENFMRDFAKNLHWKEVSKYQELSEDFIREVITKVNLQLIGQYQDVSSKFRATFGDRLEKQTNNSFLLHFDMKAKRLLKQQQNNPKMLEKGLKLSEKALFYQDEDTNDDILEIIYHTKTMLLLALNRQEEAFDIVKTILKKNEYAPDFVEFNKDKAYLAWKKYN